jgi:hypothetical protein
MEASCRRLTPAFAAAVSCSRRGGRSHYLFNDVGAGQRAAYFGRKAEAGDGKDFVEALQDAGRTTRSRLLQSTGEVADQPLGIVGIIQFRRLTQRLADAGVQGLGQTLQNVAGLVDPGLRRARLVWGFYLSRAIGFGTTAPARFPSGISGSAMPTGSCRGVCARCPPWAAPSPVAGPRSLPATRSGRPTGPA